MKLYLISNSKRYTGAVHVVYDTAGKLAKIDFTNTNLALGDVEKMLPLFSGHVSEVQAKFKNADTVIVEGDFEVSFEDFMREYPYKRNTHKARELWPRLKKEEQVQAFLAATAYRKYCDRENKWYKPKIAEAWLRGKEFLNDWKTL
jgi:hypothetical protein